MLSKPLVFGYLLLLSIFSGLNCCFGQDYQAIEARIDSACTFGLPKTALAEVEKLDRLAKQYKNAPMQVKAVIYRITLQTFIEENALVAVIDTLKQDAEKASYPVKPVLQSLLAETYWKYYEQHRWQFSQRSRLEKPDPDFTKWDLQTLINQTSNFYKLSLKDAQAEQHTSIGVFEGVLEGDRSTRYLRPTLYDLLVQRALDFFLAEEPALTKPKMPFTLNSATLFADAESFARLPISANDTTSTFYQGLKLLQQASLFHLQLKENDAAVDLDLRRIGFLYGKSALNEKDTLYLHALQHIAVANANSGISAEALTMIGQYYKKNDSLKTALLWLQKAIGGYPQSLGGKNAATLTNQINEKFLSVTTEETNVPDKPILGLLSYKNVKSARVTVYKLSQTQVNDCEYLESDARQHQFPNYNSAFPKDSIFTYLNKIKPLKDEVIQLPDPGDYRSHSAEFKIDALMPGNYLLMVKDAQSTDSTLFKIGHFRISRIAYTARRNPDYTYELRVINRTNGEPLRGVAITITGSKYVYNKAKKTNVNVDTLVNGISDANGMFRTSVVDNGHLSFYFVLKGDTLSAGSKYVNGETDDSLDDDDPEEKSVLFTDRQIYRPGQTVYFKLLQIQSLKGKTTLSTNKPVKIDFKDADRKLIKTLNLVTNNFGSAGGDFIVPQNTLPGDFSIETADGDMYFKVEEYKRPTFKVEFNSVKENYKPGDSILVKGKVTAFSGYGLSAANVAVQINRSTRMINYGNYRGHFGYRYEPDQVIETDTLKTNGQGEFKIKFKALATESVKYANYNYHINVDVTDQSAETHSGQTNVVVGEHQLNIQAYFPGTIQKSDTVKIPIQITNLNGQPQKGSLEIKVFALKQPEEVYKNRLWTVPDQHILNKDEFHKYFPSFTFDNEDKVAYWPELNNVASRHIEVTDSTSSFFSLTPLAAQPPGIYKIKISARNAAGDTLSSTQFIRVFNESTKPFSTFGWLTAVHTAVKPGENAEFLAGIGKPLNILMEKYSGSKLLLSQWIKTGAETKKIFVPVSVAGDADTYVQFLTVYQNRLYTQYQKLEIVRPDKKLDVHFLTYRNELLPGQKEEWKIKISENEGKNIDAELLAGLYDASLDDIEPAKSWTGSLITDQKSHNYFLWNNYDFVTQTYGSEIFRPYTNYSLLNRTYEGLNMLGYNYYGGYNGNYQRYLLTLKTKETNIENEKRLTAGYEKNAELVKNGYDISGIVVDADDKSALPGVSVSIVGTPIATVTDMRGFYRIKVPVNGILSFKYIGYLPKEVKTSKAGTVNVLLGVSSSSLNEVVVVGYGMQKRSDLTGAVSTLSMRSLDATLVGRVAGVDILSSSGDPSKSIMIRGASSADKASQPLYIVDGLIVDASLVNPNDIADISVLNDASAVAVYGSRAANGVIIIKTKKAVATLMAQQPTIRKNFAETAFFYPQLQTNEKGEILLNFTMPDALTKWRFRAFAHTRGLKTGYLETEVVTQKQLSISANMPRFFREGDTITVSARLANLTAKALNGKVHLQLFNGINMQPVKLLVNAADSVQDFSVAGVTNKAISFKMVIPSGLDALTYRLTAEAGNYSDGEENTFPVLPNRMLVTESMPMMVRSGQTKTFTFGKLLNQNSTTLQNKTLTLEYTQNPAWYAVQALPYLMEFPYECAEQTFSRYYANSMATSLVNRMPVIKRVFEQWKNTNSTELVSNLEKNQELKATLIEETPWLRDAENESEQKKRIALLFDLNKMSNELQANLDKLNKKQLPDGGFPWFGGDRADRYITQHILAGIGQLYHLKIADSTNADLTSLAGRGLGYLSSKLVDDENFAKLHNKNYQTRAIGETEVHAWYVNSYFGSQKLSGELQGIRTEYLKRAEKQWVYRSIYEQGMIALTMLRNGKIELAQSVIRSLKETAQQTDDMGMYWAKNQLGYFWYQSPIETQCLLIELFTEAGNNEKAIDEMKIWLLRNKQTSNWKTTKATAAACYALLLKGSDWLNTDHTTSTIKLNSQDLKALKPDTRADIGTGYIKTTWVDRQIKPALGNVEITNTGKTISWGALHWQYMEQLDKITPSHTDIQLQRKYFIEKQTDAGAVLTAIDVSHQPKTGDLLKVVVYLKAGRDFEYVQLKDMRPAGTEPVDALSTYKYQDGLYYYQVTKDVATNFFISYLNKGNYVFEYRLRVAQPGNFSTGITSIQSMYAPEFNAHSQGERMVVK